MILDRLFTRALRAVIRRGALKAVMPDGSVLTAGDGTSPRVAVRLAGWGAVARLLADPELALGELFTDGRLTVESGTLPELLRLLLQDAHGDPAQFPVPLASTIRLFAYRLLRGNDPVASRRNVAHHYDLSSELYDLFLDRNRQYSCAYFEHEGQSLDAAQVAKQRHIAAKLSLGAGQSVLEIGSGWGGLATYLARVAGAGRVRGITLSDEQLACSRRSAEAAGLSDRVAFELEDYRSTPGTFDRIVSVGMFEHVGLRDYDAFFRTCERRLAADGVMVLHTIGRTGAPYYTNPWIRKYIFPGGHLPTMSELVPAIERSGLVLCDVEVLRLHYAETLRHWRERFMARREEAARLYDERFCRMWEFYLALSEAAFRYGDTVVFQLQLAKRNDVLPLTRDAMHEEEQRLREAKGERVRAAAE